MYLFCLDCGVAWVHHHSPNCWLCGSQGESRVPGWIRESAQTVKFSEMEDPDNYLVFN